MTSKPLTIMNAKPLIRLTLLVLLGTHMLPLSAAFQPAPPARLQHIVYFKFKAGVSEAAITRHVDGFTALKSKIPQILSYASGQTVVLDNSSGEYDIVHHLTFASESDVLVFEHSPHTLQFVSLNKPSWDRSLVVNSRIDVRK
jgi:hypothetical protein